LADLSPPESRHALTPEELRKSGAKFWSVWHGTDIIGCGALQELDAEHGEVKSMRTAVGYLRKGVAGRVLEEIIAEARNRGYRRLSLETGATAEFAPAHALYSKFGFRVCPPFNGYIEDPNSVFMTLELPSPDGESHHLE
jgi:putative acetyltransferase